MSLDFSYKLGGYKITEAFGGGLWWESHHGVGRIQKGKCTTEGNILILGPTEIEEPGFLKREFLDHLNQLPNWDKTKYYCLSHSLHKCMSGARMSFKNKLNNSVVATPNAKIATGHSFENKKAPNKLLDKRKDFALFKEKLTEVLVFLNHLFNKSKVQ